MSDRACGAVESFRVLESRGWNNVRSEEIGCGVSEKSPACSTETEGRRATLEVGTGKAGRVAVGM